MPLTADERKAFSAAQLAQLDRMADQERLLTLDTSDYVQEEGESIAAFNERLAFDAGQYRAKVLGQLRNMDADRVRARVNVDGFRGSTPTFSADSDYTQAEKDAIAWGYKANVGRSWGREIPAVLAAKAEMEADGLSPAQIKAILKAR